MDWHPICFPPAAGPQDLVAEPLDDTPRPQHTGNHVHPLPDPHLPVRLPPCVIGRAAGPWPDPADIQPHDLIIFFSPYRVNGEPVIGRMAASARKEEVGNLCGTAGPVRAVMAPAMA